MFTNPLNRGAAPFLFGVFLVCMCGLMLQIVETRIISVIVYYHLAFFAISMAMLGMTAGSLLVYFRSDLFPRERLLENLGWIAAGLSIAIVLATFSLITTIAGSGVSGTLIMTALVWLKLIVILLPPYVLAGMAISLALTRSPVPVGLVYGIDLLGAASGCLIILVLLSLADAVSVMFAIAALAAIGSIAFGAAQPTSEARRPRLLWASWLGRGWRPPLLAVVFGLIAIGNAMIQPTSPGRWRDGLTLLMAKNRLELQSPEVVRWNTYSRIMVGPLDRSEPYLWGASPVLPASTVSQRYLNIDGDAATWMYQFDGDLKKIDFLKYDITNLAYTIRHEGRSAVIGVGGGRDILSAHLFGFRDITGVELNPIFVDLLTRDFRDYNQVASLPGVHLVVDEARSWFARTDQRFDLIEMSLIDTWAATGAGAYSLSENGLYTEQGWHHFLSALTPAGVFTVSRWFSPDDVTETGRLVSLAAQSLRDEGVVEPKEHLFVATTDNLATVIVGKSAFTPDELASLRERAESLQFKVLFSPDRPDPDQILTKIIAARSPEELSRLSRERHVDVSVTTDDRPFFFNELNLLDLVHFRFRFAAGGDQGIVRGNLMATATLALIIALSGILVLFTMIFPALPAVSQTPKPLARLGTLYFLLIGFGFMFMEIGLIQRLSAFLGHPVYGLAIGLFGIIISTGIGSLVSERMQLATPEKILSWLGLLGLYLVALPLWFPQLVAEFEGRSLIARAVVSLAAIVPSGMLMGFGFPTGMRLVGAIDARPTPWFWSVNGAAGVLGASVAVVTSINFSINVTLWIGAACYLLLAPVAVGLLALTRFPRRAAAAVA
jgi:hypothetical protein